MRLQKEKKIVVDPVSLKRPSFRLTHFETTSPKGTPTSDNTPLHPAPSLQPSKHKFSGSTRLSSVISSPQSQELPRKVSNLTHKNHHLQRRSMSLFCSKGKTHAVPDEFHLRMSENDNRNQESFSKNEATIKNSPKGSKRMEDDGFKCCALGMCLLGFGKAKPVKARKGGTKMDHSVNDPVNVMSSTFSISFENFELNSRVTQGRIVRENNEDDSISSYFELPSNML